MLIDPSQLESSILNLAINARDAMPKAASSRSKRSPPISTRPMRAAPRRTPGHYVMVAVSDAGTGMSPELLEKVFQPFFTTKEQGKGSGLGLSMVYGFIKQSGGHINIYSEVGHGTSVKMYLPRKISAGEISAERRHEAVPAIEVVPARGCSVRSCEAARHRRYSSSRTRKRCARWPAGSCMDFGYDMVEAEDGLQALARLQEDPDIDLMFSDVVMPGGMNGFDLAQAASGIRPDLKIVHTSGYPKGAMVHQEEPRFRQGFIIMKPYRREELQKIIRDAFEKQS